MSVSLGGACVDLNLRDNALRQPSHTQQHQQHYHHATDVTKLDTSDSALQQTETLYEHRRDVYSLQHVTLCGKK